MDLSDLITINFQEIPLSSIFFTKKTFLWCKCPYPNYPNGCPNYNGELCPPNTPYLELDKAFYSFKYYFLIYLQFNFRQYINERRKLKPDWSIKQLGNRRHWQSSIKAKLKYFILNLLKINNFHKEKDFYILSCGSGFKSKDINQFQNPIYSMEAVGIYVLKTLKENNIKIEFKPDYNSILHFASLFCSNKEIIMNEEKYKYTQKKLESYIK